MINDFSDKSIAILGIGMEGIALIDFLSDKVREITIFDQRSAEELIKKAEPELLSKTKAILKDSDVVKVLGQSLDQADLDDFNIIFRSPSVPYNHPKLVEARKAGRTVSSQIKLFFELCPCRIIGVTGTKGKGTTASLISEILKKTKNYSDVYLAGNIGIPAITLIPSLKKDDIVILELSNFQLADMVQSPQIAVVTNLGTDHLDYHATREEYVDAKFNILKYQSENDICILNRESTFDDLTGMKSKKIYFSNKGDRDQADAVIVRKDGLDELQIRIGENWVKVCDQSEINLAGRHNLENIAAASIVGTVLGVSIDDIKEAVRHFEGLPFRLDFIREISGVRYYNDSFATNPGPTIAAIDAFAEDKIMIFGGSSKNADFTDLAQKVSESNVVSVILIGAERERIKQALLLANFKGYIVEAKSLEEVVVEAANIAKAGSVVIFSPACASFDMFKNYKDRGKKFGQAVLDFKDNE